MVHINILPIDMLEVMMDHLNIGDIRSICMTSLNLRKMCTMTKQYHQLSAIINSLHLHGRKNKIPQDMKMTDFMNIVLYIAAQHSNTHIFEMLRSLERCLYDDQPSIIFAQNDDLHALQTIHSFGYAIASNYIGIIAARNNNFDMLKWAFKLGCKGQSCIALIAKLHSNQEMLSFAKENGC
jgi:hypothetical protein